MDGDKKEEVTAGWDAITEAFEAIYQIKQIQSIMVY